MCVGYICRLDLIIFILIVHFLFFLFVLFFVTLLSNKTLYFAFHHLKILNFHVVVSIVIFVVKHSSLVSNPTLQLVYFSHTFFIKLIKPFHQYSVVPIQLLPHFL